MEEFERRLRAPKVIGTSQTYQQNQLTWALEDSQSLNHQLRAYTDWTYASSTYLADVQLVLHGFPNNRSGACLWLRLCGLPLGPFPLARLLCLAYVGEDAFSPDEIWCAQVDWSWGGCPPSLWRRGNGRRCVDGWDLEERREKGLQSRCQMNKLMKKY